MKTSHFLTSLFFTSFLYAQQIGDGRASELNNFSVPLRSGIYQGYLTNGMNPDQAFGWQHLFVIRHSNDVNNYQLQLSSSYTQNDRLFFRKIAGSGLEPNNPAWIELATRETNTFNGDQNIKGNLILNGVNEDHGQIIFENSNHGVRRIENIMDVFTSGGPESAITFTPRSYNPATNSYSIMNVALKIDSNGNVGIGKTNPINKLDVNGTIHSKEVKVDMIGWSDFVFKKEYNLPTLAEVEKHINEKGHLENIPNEEEVLKNGINLGEMNAKLLQKIEELTLYMIEMKKENEKQNEEIKILKNKLSSK